MDIQISTLCYIESDDKYLMLHRVKKARDINKGKWIGVGGHFLHGESPEECLVREVKEETGLDLTAYRFRGIVTFVYGDQVTEYMHLFTAALPAGESSDTVELPDCNEGILKWVAKPEVLNLELWPGDRIFLRLLGARENFFSLKLQYNEADELEYAALDGVPIDAASYIYSIE